MIHTISDYRVILVLSLLFKTQNSLPSFKAPDRVFFETCVLKPKKLIRKCIYKCWGQNDQLVTGQKVGGSSSNKNQRYANSEEFYCTVVSCTTMHV